jgi:replicative DNA helicase
MVQSIDDVRRRQQASRQGPGGRVPPHNLQAEESLLGAMLLSREAIADAVEICHAEDFYKPAHSHVFEAITSLYSQGEPVDLVTVAEELRRADLLEAIGGPTLLLTLQGSTPATSNAARYARIVEEHALLRRLIGVAGEIAELGYSLPDDVESAVDRAETMMFEVAQHRTADTMAPLRSLIDQSLDRLEQLYERNEAITGTPTGFIDLDELTSGLQPSALIIVGARPGMGKALALDTPIPTPDGWTTMGELAPGDLVIDEQGHPCRVTYTSPVFVGNRCFEIHFDDGSTIVADADHRWLAYDLPAWNAHLDRASNTITHHPRIVTTQEMVDEGVRTVNTGAPNWHIPVAALALHEQELLVDPYDLGRSLADIPATHLRASWKQRLELLQGVMDSAGALTADGVEVCLADRSLAEKVWELVCSLGHKARPIRQNPVRTADGRIEDAWAFAWTPVDPVFRLPQSADELARRARLEDSSEATRRAIVGISEVRSVPTRCISVDSPNHLFLAGDSMIPTHNTSFGLGMAAHAGMVERKPVLFFSLEMSHLELTSRLLCAEAKVDSSRLRNGKLLDADWEKIHRAIGSLAEAPIYIDDNPNTTIMEIRSKARRLKAKEGDLGLVVVDYLQLMTGRSSAESRQVEVAEMSRGLKILARELHCPVVALSQLSRNLESRGDKRPMLADLRESGSLEQDADVVMFLYRDEIYNPDSADKGIAEVIVAKHRNGPTGITNLAFLDRYTRFANMARV